MSNYRRAYMNGGTWFFTVNLLQRHQNDLLIRNIDLLRHTVKNVLRKYPYWEHCIRDDSDYQRHVDYVHANPLKHGHVARVIDWPYSTFHQYVAKGIYPADWCGDMSAIIDGDD